MDVAKGLLVSVLCLSSGLLAAQSHHSQWKKVYERDLTDFELSPEGSGLVLFAQLQGRCRMDVDFYGETGKDKVPVVEMALEPDRVVVEPIRLKVALAIFLNRHILP